MNNNLSKNVQRLIVSHSLAMFGRSIFNIFFVVFLWGETNSLRSLAIYSIALITAHIISFTLFASVVKKGKHHTPRVLSLIGSSIIYLILFILKDYVANHLILTGSMIGFFNGMYWISYLFLQFETTHTKNRGNFNGTMQALTTSISIFAPILGGAAIGLNFLNLGYGNIFIISIIVYIFSIFIGFVKVENHKSPPLHYRKTLKLIWQKKDIVKLILARFFGNIGYKGAIERLLPVFIFDIINSELHLGGLLSLFSLFGIIVVLFLGKKVPYSKYRFILTIGGSLFFIATMTLVGFPILFTYIFYGFAREIFLPLLQIPAKTYRDNLLHQIPDYKNHRVEYIVIREWIYVFASRVVGYGLFFFVPSISSTAFQIVLAIMASAILIDVLIMRSIKTNLSNPNHIYN